MAFVYSCCFWFSLRLGGIMIGIFSMAVVILTVLALMRDRQQEVRDQIGSYIDNMNLLFGREYLESFRADPEKYLTLGMCATSFYIIFCLMYIYGAYKCSIMMMTGYILTELLRLTSLSMTVIVWLLVIKQTTMDIGLLIGASVAGGFTLLGLFYLWVCALNLPFLVTEMERDDQAAAIAKLQKMVDANAKARFPIPRDTTMQGKARYDTDVFTVSPIQTKKGKGKPFGDSTSRHGRWN